MPIISKVTYLTRFSSIITIATIISAYGSIGSMNRQITRIEAARMLGVSPATVGNWIRNGLIPLSGGTLASEDVELLQQRLIRGEIPRLKSRANKTGSSRKFVPAEYASVPVDFLDMCRGFLNDFNGGLHGVMFSAAANLLKSLGEILPESIESPDPAEWRFSRKGTAEQMNEWFAEASILADPTICKNALGIILYDQNYPDGAGDEMLSGDMLGGLYQSLLHEGHKSGAGSYYTPEDLCDDLTRRFVKPGMRVLDPCCGTGQFLLSFARCGAAPSDIFGFDTDRTAVRIAGINMLMHFPRTEFRPRVFCVDTLLIDRKLPMDAIIANPAFPTEASQGLKNAGGFDVVATNPPWGARYSREYRTRLNGLYPEIDSGESCSLFILQCFSLLNPRGRMSLLIPESLTNIRAHSDIRSFLLSRTHIAELHVLGKRFTRVYSSAVHGVFEKKAGASGKVRISVPGERYEADVERFERNPHFTFDVYVSPRDEKIMRTVYGTSHVTLKGNARWVLGVVTGNNASALAEKSAGTLEPVSWEDGAGPPEPVYTGKDVSRYRLSGPRLYMRYRKEAFQQAASIASYRISPKLIYRFIAREPVVALDASGSITLNSANILIPEIEGLSPEAVMGFLNSTLQAFIFRKRFHAVKVLRGDLEELPFPVLDSKRNNMLTRLVMDAIAGNAGGKEIDGFVFDCFGIDEKDRAYITETVQRRK